MSASGGCNVCPLCADVAQLVEQRFRKPQVTGSNPVVGSSLRSQQSGDRGCRAVVSAEADRLTTNPFCRELRLGRPTYFGLRIDDCRNSSRARDLMSELRVVWTSILNVERSPFQKNSA